MSGLKKFFSCDPINTIEDCASDCYKYPGMYVLPFMLEVFNNKQIVVPAGNRYFISTLFVKTSLIHDVKDCIVLAAPCLAVPVNYSLLDAEPHLPLFIDNVLRLVIVPLVFKEFVSFTFSFNPKYRVFLYGKEEKKR